VNASYRGPGDCPTVIPVFPLATALLLPRGRIPLNVFEPRYLAMIDAALASDRVIGMIQPMDEGGGSDRRPALYRVGCAGRLVQFAETGDGRYVLSLAGIARFTVLEEVGAETPFRQVRVSYEAFAEDFKARSGEAEVDRESVLSTLREFAEANNLKIDWDGVAESSNEALVNALSMMSPFGVREKQALLEAADLKTRAEMLVAITQMELAKGPLGQDTPLQ
jgi:Lon protease-like protein